MKNQHWLGKQHSEESKLKMSLAQKEKWARIKNNPELLEQVKKNIGNASRGRIGKRREQSPMWKGGRKTCKRDGYVSVIVDNHPNAKIGGGGGTRTMYMLEHRLVMEKVLGRYLNKNEDVHHINGIKDDNRPENLMLVTHIHHFHEHGCPKCGFKFFTK